MPYKTLSCIKPKILDTYVGERSSQDMTARQNTVTPASVLPSGKKTVPSVCNYYAESIFRLAISPQFM